MNNNDKQFVMLHDEKRCIGCQACTVACKVINDIPEGFSRLQVQIQGPHLDEKGNPHYQFFRVSCQHCEDAPCVSVCPTGASFIDENGIVQVKKALCIGCDYCVSACTYHVRYINPTTHTADKCNFCADTRLAQGELPACVTVCPTDALLFGRLDSPQIQTWLKQKSVYQFQHANIGKPHLFRRKECHQGDKL